MSIAISMQLLFVPQRPSSVPEPPPPIAPLTLTVNVCPTCPSPAMVASVGGPDNEITTRFTLQPVHKATMPGTNVLVSAARPPDIVNVSPAALHAALCDAL